MAKKILLGVLVLVVLVGGLAWWLVQATGEPVKVIRAHLEAINQDDYSRAYSYLSANAQANMTLEEFKAFVEKNSAVLKTRDASFPSRKISNNVATIRGTLTGRQGQVATVRFTLEQEEGVWKIAAMKLRASPSED